MGESLYPFRSPLDREALRDALNAADSLSWAVRDSIYYGVYLRAWHPQAGKLRIFGDGPQYVFDMGDDPPESIVRDLDAWVETKLATAAQAVRDPAALEMLPFPAAPLNLWDDSPPREEPAEASQWSALGEGWKSADPTLTMVALQVGTPASFYSENPRQPTGHHFDICGLGTTDNEIDLHSPQLTERMMRRTPKGSPDTRIMRSGEWAFFKNEGPGGFYRECPQLLDVARKWSDLLGRDIEFRLRISLDPISSVKTPGKGGPIELFRIGAPAAVPRVEAPAAKPGLWQRMRAAFRRTPPAGTVEIDGVGARRWLANGKQESVRWDALTKVEVMTTDDGPAADDVFWVLHGSDGAGCVIPSEAEGCDQLLARLQELPGFDNEAVIKAMGSTAKARFLAWKRSS
jgi:hypothetical protein